MKIKFLLLLVTLFAFTFSCEEDDQDINGTATVGFSLTNLLEVENATAPLKVNIEIGSIQHSGGTINVAITGAEYGVDYETNKGSDTFTLDVDAQRVTANFNIQPIDNDLVEGDKQLTITITSVTGAFELAENNATNLTLVDDDTISVKFVNDAVNISEADGTYPIEFSVTQATTEDTDVTISVGGDADATDYDIEGQNVTPYTFTIPAGSTTHTLTMNILDDMIPETTESVELIIIESTGGATTGTVNQGMVISIGDDDVTAFNEVETFEGAGSLGAVGFETVVLSSQDLPTGKAWKYNMNAGKYSDVNDVTQTSDTGIVIFYNITQNGAGVIDNVIISDQYAFTGAANVEIDIAYSQVPAVNNATVTFYYSETYTGNGVWDEADWQVMGTETAADMLGEGFSTNDYKRKSMNITTTNNFYVSVRVNQTIDATFSKTQWRMDNFRVQNQ